MEQTLEFAIGETREAKGPGFWTLPAGAYRVHRVPPTGGFSTGRLQVAAGELREVPVEKGERVAVTREA